MTKNTSVRRGLSVLAAACLAVGAAGVITMPAAHAAQPANAQEAAMVPLPLTRIVDSREALGVAKAPANNEVAEVKVAGELTIGGKKQTLIPADADAVVLNMTAVNATASGYFVAWPAGGTRPPTSNINFMTGDIVANGAVVPIGTDGKIKVFTRGSADILMDVAGYYRDGTYTAQDSSRLWDSRQSPEGSTGDKKVTLVNTGANEGDILTLNITADQAKGGGYLTVWPTQETVDADSKGSLLGMPLTSNLNYSEGQTIANTVQVKAGKGGYVSIYAMTDTNLIVDQVARLKYQSAGNGNWGAAPEQALYEAVNLSTKAQRVLDTRVALGSDKKTGYRSINLLSDAGDSPNTYGSAVINVTVTGAKADGFVSVGSGFDESKTPTTSVLNYKAGQTIANRVTIPASYLGSLQVYSHSEADIIVDVMGYTEAPTLSGDDVPAKAELDLSKATKTSVVTPADANAKKLVNLSAESAIAFKTETTDATETIHPDGAGGSKIWNIDGTTATVIDAANAEKSITIKEHADGEHKYVPLTGLKPGSYTLRVPIKDNQTGDDMQKATYETAFSIGSLGATGGPVMEEVTWHSATYEVTAYAHGTGTGEASVTLAGTGSGNFTATTGNVGSAATKLAALYDAMPAFDASVNGAVVTLKKYRASSALANPAANSINGDGTFTVGNAAGAADGTAEVEAEVAAAAGTTAADELILAYPAPQSVTVYAASADAQMLTAPQQLEVKMPSGFFQTGDSDDVVKLMSGEDQVGSDQTIGADTFSIAPPQRSDFTGDLKLTNELMAVVTSTDGADATNKVTIKLMLK